MLLEGVKLVYTDNASNNNNNNQALSRWQCISS